MNPESAATARWLQPCGVKSRYDADYQRWLEQTVEQLKSRDFNNLDLEKLIEEIKGLGRSDKRAIESYLTRLCEHLLNMIYWQSGREWNFRGWRVEIDNFCSEIKTSLQDSPILRPFLNQVFLPRA